MNIKHLITETGIHRCHPILAFTAASSAFLSDKDQPRCAAKKKGTPLTIMDAKKGRSARKRGTGTGLIMAEHIMIPIAAR